MQLSELVRWNIRPRLMAVPGVANVAVWGQRDRQLQVLVDPDRLRAAGVTLAEVRAATSDAVLVGGGGFVDTPNQRLAVQQSGTVQSAAELAQAIVKQAGEAPVRIGDVTRVVDGFSAPIGNTIIDDGPGIMLIVEYRPSMLEGFAINGGAFYTGRRSTDEQERAWLPGYTTYSLGARQRIALTGRRPVTLQVNVDNLSNKRYWSVGGSTLYVGLPRTARATVSYEF